MQNSCVTNNNNAKLLGLFFLEAVPQRCFIKKVFPKISQNEQAQASPGVSVLKKQPASLQQCWKRDSSPGVLL